MSATVLVFSDGVTHVELGWKSRKPILTTEPGSLRRAEPSHWRLAILVDFCDTHFGGERLEVVGSPLVTPGTPSRGEAL